MRYWSTLLKTCIGCSNSMTIWVFGISMFYSQFMGRFSFIRIRHIVKGSASVLEWNFITMEMSKISGLFQLKYHTCLTIDLATLWGHLQTIGSMHTYTCTIYVNKYSCFLCFVVFCCGFKRCSIPSLVVLAPADSTEPNGGRSSAGTVLTTNLDMFSRNPARVKAMERLYVQIVGLPISSDSHVNVSQENIDRVS